jgi:hypothetical protein
MPRHTIRLYALIIALAALCLGGILGYRHTLAIKHASDLALSVTEFESIHTYIDTQLREGTDTAREDALRTHIAYTERMRARHDPLFDAKVMNIGSALDYIRLAILARHRNAEDEARQDTLRALNYCRNLGPTACNVDKLTQLVRATDKAGIFK